MENAKLEYLELIPKKVDKLFILLHGYGVDKEDLFGLGMQFRELLPNTAFISVNAPCKCENGFGYQWFSLQKMNLFSILKEIRISYKLLNNFIDQQLKRFSLQDKDLFLCGFSQGAIMSLYTSLRREETPLGVISFSGMMPETVETLKRELKSKPNILLVHGTMDQMVPFQMMQKSIDLLKQFDIPFESHAIDGMGHMIDDEALKYAKDFIKKISNRKK